MKPPVIRYRKPHDNRVTDLLRIEPLLRQLYVQSQDYDVEAAATLGELAAMLPGPPAMNRVWRNCSGASATWLRRGTQSDRCPGTELGIDLPVR